jgi:predicted PolB exonuclease-like 3'-5' exonuclease
VPLRFPEDYLQQAKGGGEKINLPLTSRVIIAESWGNDQIKKLKWRPSLQFEGKK